MCAVGREGGNVCSREVMDGEGSKEGSWETGWGAKGRMHVIMVTSVQLPFPLQFSL